MEPYQWFLLGIMIAWTPGLVVLAILLARTPRQSPEQHRSVD